jgi:single-strand DNA-binding protein
MNKAIVAGNLGQDPELRSTQGGTSVLNLRLATNERVKRGDQWEDHAEWHSVVVFGKRADALSKFLAKGSQVLIEGKLRTRQWEDRDGNKRYTTEVIADDVQVFGKRSRDADPGPSDGDYGGDDIGF